MLVYLDLGCGSKKKENYIGVDITRTNDVDIIANIENLPFKNNTIDKIYSRHTLEHINDFEKTIKEIYRVSRPNVVLEVIVPFWGHSIANHPLHKRFFNYFSFDDYSVQKTEKTFIPFCNVKFSIKKRKYIFQRKRFPFSIFYVILEKLASKFYNTYESTFANIFPAYEICFELQVVK